MSTPIETWLKNSTRQELLDGVDWLQSDAAYTYSRAREYAALNRAETDFVATRVQQAAAHSSAYARAGLARAGEMA